jgi:hypothetical protein
MLITLGSDKGSPGVTTLAAVLGLVWNGARAVTELDPRGADLPLRLTRAGGGPLLAAPSVVGLALAARDGFTAPAIERYVQDSEFGIPVVAGELSALVNARIAGHLPGLATTANAWHGTLIADLGNLHATNPAMVVARAAAAVVLVVRPTMEGLAHLRESIGALTEQVGDPRRDRSPVGVVVVAESSQRRPAIGRTRQLLDSIGSAAPVVGAFAYDPPAAAALWSGPMTKKLSKSALIQSGHALAAQLLTLWPELSPLPSPYPQGASGLATNAEPMPTEVLP